jgi:DNA-binding GntR family transcriptional regulator
MSRPDARGALTPVVQESTPSMIAARIREAIASGVIAPGSQLGEADYARQLGVSRGPLREGLQRLTQEGLLISHRNRGLFVIEMTRENVTDMYLAREAVERAAAARIHRDDPAHTAGALLAVVDTMAAAARRRDVVAVSVADIEFHQVLVEHAHSPRLSRVHRTLLTETRMCIHALEPTYAVAETRVGEHRAIAESFEHGDPELTDRLLVLHMQDAVQRLTGPVEATDQAG